MPRIAHMSDLHLSPLPKSRLSSLFNKRMIGYVNWQRNRKQIHSHDLSGKLAAHLKAQKTDHTVLTGDLTNLSLPEEFEAVKAWLEAFDTSDKLSVIPGNHDAYVSISHERGLGKWQPYMQSCHQGQEIRDKLDIAADTSFPYLRLVDKVAIIGLSSAVPMPPLIAAGKLGNKQLQALREILEYCNRQGLFRLILIHHPPLIEKHHYFHGLRDVNSFHEVMKNKGAELVLHGHNHRHQLHYISGPKNTRIPVIGTASASQIHHKSKPDGRYNLYDIFSNTTSWQINLHSIGHHRETGTIQELETEQLTLAK